MHIYDILEHAMAGIGIAAGVAIFFFGYLNKKYGSIFVFTVDTNNKYLGFFLGSAAIIAYTITNVKVYVFVCLMSYAISFGLFDLLKRIVNHIYLMKSDSQNESGFYKNELNYELHNRRPFSQKVKSFFASISGVLIVVVLCAIALGIAFILRFHNPIPEKYWAPLVLIGVLLWPVIKVLFLILQIKQIENDVNRKR